MNALYRLFAREAGLDPHRPLLRNRPGGRWVTREDLLRRAGRLAATLEGRGVGRGSVVLVATGSRPAFVESVLASWSLEAVVLPVEDDVTPAEIEHLCKGFPIAAGIGIRGGRPRIVPLPGGGRQRMTGAAIIRLTSGTTGAPRGSIVTAAQAAADGRAIIRKMGIRPEDLNVAAIPLSHSYGFDNIVLPLILQGTPALLLPSPLPGLILRALRSPRPVVLPAVPFLLDLLTRHHDEPPSPCALRLCISAGAPLPPRTAAGFLRRFGVPVRTFYGSSECGGITFDDGRHGEPAEGCVGTPLPGVRLSIDRRGLRGLAPGEGRIVVAGPAVASRYFPDVSEDLRAGRFRTSDLGRLDENGRLHLTGRLTSLINVSGRKVNPAEVERALLDLREVIDAAVLGVADPRRGERVEAWLVASSGTSEALIRKGLAQRLSPWKLPRVLRFVRHIPRTARGKLDRRALLASTRSEDDGPAAALRSAP